jgi:hypothetical protein
MCGDFHSISRIRDAGDVVCPRFIYHAFFQAIGVLDEIPAGIKESPEKRPGLIVQKARLNLDQGQVAFATEQET